jgi:hypothetical protein
VRSAPKRLLATWLLAAVALGCSIGVPAGDRPPPPPSEADARAYLATIVGLAMRGDFDGLCAVGSGTCPKDLREAGREAVPPIPPRVVGTRVLMPESRGDSWSSGGFVLQVCGVDGRGEPYFDEVLVFREGERLISIGTVYWSRIRIAEGQTTGGPQTTPPPECPA